MSLAQNFTRTVEVMVARATTGPQVRKWLADEARANVAELVASGSATPNFRRFVNGVEDADPATLKLDGSGSISYLFSRMAEAAGYALQYAMNRSPVDSGEYKRSWYLLVNAQPFTSGDLTQIPLGAEVTLTNSADYHRKIDVGGQRMRVAPQIVEATRQAVMRKFPGIVAERLFITIPGGYVLKGHAYRSGLSYNKKAKVYVQIKPRTQTRRADARKGQPMTYPSLVMHEPI